MNDSLHIVCGHCHAVNRLPENRLRDAPVCGRCGRHLFEAHPVELDQNSFGRHVERSGIPVLVDFWASWCGPCRTMAPAFEQAARELEPGFRLAKLDTEAAPALSARYGIRSIPTLMIFRGGREIARQAGAMDARSIVAWARSQATAG